jgi:hypothetical protein
MPPVSMPYREGVMASHAFRKAYAMENTPIRPELQIEQSNKAAIPIRNGAMTNGVSGR